MLSLTYIVSVDIVHMYHVVQGKQEKLNVAVAIAEWSVAFDIALLGADAESCRFKSQHELENFSKTLSSSSVFPHSSIGRALDQ